MRMSWKQIMVAAGAAIALSACGNVSRNVAKDGQGAGEMVWPAPDSVTPMHKGGTFPNVANLKQVRPGLNKQQVSDLIGYPHFREGIWGVREWNYVFNFRKPDSGEVTVCQYKVLFDENALARSFYWQPASCAAILEPPKPTDQAKKKSPQRFTLAADALFAFGSADVSPAGKNELADLATQLNEHVEQVRHIRITGYTDRLGTAVGNHDLSERRARAVADVLANDGVPRTKIFTEGAGASDPVKDCADGPHAQLVACLAPNRRVEVKVD